MASPPVTGPVGAASPLNRLVGMDPRATVEAMLKTIQSSLFDEALAMRSARTVETTSIGEAADAAREGFVRIPYEALGTDGEAKLAESAVTVRCLQRADGTVPDSEDEPDLVAFVARSY